MAGSGPKFQFLFQPGPGLGRNFYFYFEPGLKNLARADPPNMDTEGSETYSNDFEKKTDLGQCLTPVRQEQAQSVLKFLNDNCTIDQNTIARHNI